MSHDDLVRDELFRVLIDAGMCECHSRKLACEVAREFKNAGRELDELETDRSWCQQDSKRGALRWPRTR